MNKWERRLSVAITTGLVTGCAYMPATFAMSDVQQEKVTPTNTFTTTLTGKIDNKAGYPDEKPNATDLQTQYLDAGVYDKDKNEYTFTQDTFINIKDEISGKHANITNKGISVLNDLSINANDKNLNINVIGSEKPYIDEQGKQYLYEANGINNFAKKLKIDANTVNINVDGNKAGANGIYLLQSNKDEKKSSNY